MSKVNSKLVDVINPILNERKSSIQTFHSNPELKKSNSKSKVLPLPHYEVSTPTKEKKIISNLMAY